MVLAKDNLTQKAGREKIIVVPLLCALQIPLFHHGFLLNHSTAFFMASTMISSILKIGVVKFGER